jgi:hypothetical protein
MGKTSNKEKYAKATSGMQSMTMLDKRPKSPEEAAKKYNRLSFTINLEEKLVDGKKTISGDFLCYDYNKPSELKEEFTDPEKLKEKATSHIDAFVKALQK